MGDTITKKEAARAALAHRDEASSGHQESTDSDRSAFLAEIRAMPEYKGANAPGAAQPEVGAATMGASKLRDRLDSIRQRGNWRGHGGIRTALADWGSLGLSPNMVKGDVQKQLAAALGYAERQEFEAREAESKKREPRRAKKDFAEALKSAFKGVEGVEVEDE